MVVSHGIWLCRTRARRGLGTMRCTVARDPSHPRSRGSPQAAFLDLDTSHLGEPVAEATVVVESPHTATSRRARASNSSRSASSTQSPAWMTRSALSTSVHTCPGRSRCALGHVRVRHHQQPCRHGPSEPGPRAPCTSGPCGARTIPTPAGTDVCRVPTRDGGDAVGDSPVTHDPRQPPKTAPPRAAAGETRVQAHRHRQPR